MLISFHDVDNIYFITISVHENHRVDIFFQDSKFSEILLETGFCIMAV